MAQQGNERARRGSSRKNFRYKKDWRKSKEEAQNDEVPAGTKIYLISSFIAILLYIDGHIVDPRFENIPFMIITAVMGFIINIGGVAIYLSGGRKQKVVGVLVNLVSYCAILPFFIFG